VVTSGQQNKGVISVVLNVKDILGDINEKTFYLFNGLYDYVN
jgi:hypothetical protein